MKIMIFIIFLVAFQIGCTSQNLNFGSGKFGSNNGPNVSAQVFIGDQSGQPVPGVTVTGTWSGAGAGQSTAVTNMNGVAILVVPNSTYSGKYTLTVTSVSKSGLNYDPSRNIVSQGSIVK